MSMDDELKAGFVYLKVGVVRGEVQQGPRGGGLV